MPRVIMLAAPVNTFTIAAAWVRSSFHTFVKYVIITHMAYHASDSAHDRAAMEEEEERALSIYQ
jgi:membrane protein YqaA with SNARE-associated domain